MPGLDPGIHDFGSSMRPASDDQIQFVISTIAEHPARMRVLEIVRDLDLPDCWIGGGFVRSPIWDRLSGRAPAFPDGDIDVLWFDPARTDPALDAQMEQRLAGHDPSLDWSVKNQARMHLRNGDAPYASTADAMRHWVETATAVAVRLAGSAVEVSAPLGLDDLFSMTLRPTAAFTGAKRAVFHERRRLKRWQERWPRLILADEVVDARDKPGHDA